MSARADGSQQPQWSSPTATTATTTTAVKPSGLAKGAGSQLYPLTSTPFDVKRWINSAVAHQLSGTDASGTATSGAAAEEQAVSRVLAQAQAHAQHVSSAIDEQISQAIVRLPRTTMELQRMTAEAGDLSAQLQQLRDGVRPAVETRNQAHMQKLNALKDSQTRLRRCAAVLQKALHVEARTAEVTTSLKQLSLGDGSSGSNSNNIIKGGGGAAGRASSTAAAQVGVAQLSADIRSIKADLAELQELDPSFGERYVVVLEKHEQVIERALEHECLAHLAEHDAVRAAELLRPLQLIGRAEVVLLGYAAAASRDCVAAIEGAVGGGGVAAGALAQALRDRVVPTIKATLEGELNFILLLSQCLAATTTKTKTTAAATATTTSSGSGGYDPQLQKAMDHIIERISGAFKAAVAPVLETITDNSVLIDCYEATRGVTISTATASATAAATATPPNGMSAAEEGGPSATTATTTTTAASATSSTTTTTRLGTKERAVMQVSSLALNSLLSVFQSPTVMEAFCERTARGIAPPALSAAAAGAVSVSGKDGDAAGDHRTLAQVLSNTHARGELVAAILGGVKDVLRFFPDKTLPPCVERWSVALSDSLTRPLLHRSAPPQPQQQQQQQTPSPSSSPAAASPSSSAAPLVVLAVIVKGARPLLQGLRRDVEAFLSSAEAQHRFPSSAAAAAAKLSAALWEPLLSQLDTAAAEAQETVKASVLNAVLATVDGYGQLSVWGPAGAAAVRSGVSGGVTAYQPGHAAPTEAVRAFGEALMGAALALESLKEESGNAEAALERLLLPSSGRGADARVAAPLVALVRDGVEEVVGDRLAEWLEDILRAAVDAFVLDTVHRLRVGAAWAGTGGSGGGEGLRQAQEQLVADLEYVRNVLSAVGEEQFEVLEECLSVLSHATLPSDALPLVIGDFIKQQREGDRRRATEAGAGGGAAETPAS